MNRFPSRRAALVLTLAACMTSGCAQFRENCARVVPGRPSRASIETQLKLARLQERKGKLTSAREIYAHVLEDDADNVEAMHRMGIVAARIGEPDKAESYFQRAMQLEPLNVDVKNDYGYALFLAGDLERSEQVLRRALRDDANNHRVLDNLAMVVGASGRTEESFNLFRRVVGVGEAHANVGYLLAQSGDIDGAMKRYSAAVSADPNLRPASHAMLQLAKLQEQRDAFLVQRAKQPAEVVADSRQVTPAPSNAVARADFVAEPAPAATTNRPFVPPPAPVTIVRAERSATEDDRAAFEPTPEHTMPAEAVTPRELPLEGWETSDAPSDDVPPAAASRPMVRGLFDGPDDPLGEIEETVRSEEAPSSNESVEVAEIENEVQAARTNASGWNSALTRAIAPQPEPQPIPETVPADVSIADDAPSSEFAATPSDIPMATTDDMTTIDEPIEPEPVPEAVAVELVLVEEEPLPTIEPPRETATRPEAHLPARVEDVLAASVTESASAPEAVPVPEVDETPAPGESIELAEARPRPDVDASRWKPTASTAPVTLAGRLERQLGSGSPLSRMQAALQLRFIDEEHAAAIETLSRHLVSGTDEERLFAATALASGPASDSVLPALKLGTRDELPEVHLHVMLALARYAEFTDRALPVVRDYLADPDPEIRRLTAVGIERSGLADPLRDELLERVNDANEDDRVREAAAEALRRLAQSLRRQSAKVAATGL